MKNYVIYLAICCLVICQVAAQMSNCQYKVTEDYTVLENHYFLNNQRLDGEITYTYEQISQNLLRFHVYNPFNFPVEIKFRYLTLSSWFGNGDWEGKGIIEPRQYGDIDTYKGSKGAVSDIKMQILDPQGLTISVVPATYQRTVCKMCGGAICGSDGQACSRNDECGGQHCVRSQCTNSSKCFNNDCKCSDSQIQCNNEQCVGRGLLDKDNKPTCSPLECFSNITDPKTGLCDSIPPPNVYPLIIILLIITVIFLIVYQRRRNRMY